MPTETRVCQNCKENFTIEPEDFDFYKKIDVPAPTFCPDCRCMRRYAWRNDRNLYRRNCDLCEKSIVTMYSPAKPFKVYCSSCWWSDKWDAEEYGREIDPSKSFFDQFAELQRVVPRIALMGKNSIRSEYTNHSSDNKDSYMCSSAVRCENVMYSDFIFTSRDVVDCLYTYGKAERCYQCINIDNSYQCQYSILISSSSNCFYCYDMRGCTDCFLSFNLRNKSNYFLNKPYSKEEYREKVKAFQLGSYADRQKLYKQFLDLVEKEAIHKYAVIERSERAIGDYIFNSKNVVQAFDVAECEDSKYVINVDNKIKNVMDVYRCGEQIELLYECTGQIRNFGSKFCNLTYDVANLEYCDNSFNSQNLFGCIGVKKGQYMILNKKYSPEEYKKFVAEIKEQMKARGEYGEFFPMRISPFGYNESHNVFFGKELTREEVLAKGWNWEDKLPGTYGKETMRPEDIPDSIDQVEDSILQAALKCVDCGRNYNIIRPEFDFYRKENVPIPRQCYPCRDFARIRLKEPRKLWYRQCMCEIAGHPDHESGRCPNEFETPYAPERKEKVYCESCYNTEVV